MRRVIMSKYNSFITYLSILILCSFSYFAQASAPQKSQYQVVNRVTWQASWELRADNVTERERVTLWLAISSNHPISGEIKVEELKVAGVFSETTDRPSYSHQTGEGQKQYLANYRYDLYPSRAGNYTLPELAISVNQGDNEWQLHSESFVLEVGALPREAMGAISSSNYALTQKVTKREIMSGGVISRTITQSASDLPGYLIGPLPPMASFDERVELTHGRESHTTDQFRGSLTGTKSSNIHYRFLEAGEYQLPEVEVSWWDNNKGVLETETIAAIDVIVVAPPPPPFKERVAILWFEITENAPIWWYQNQIWVFLSILMLLGGYFARNRINQQLQVVNKYIKAAKDSSLYYTFKLFISAIRSQKNWQKAFYQWMRQNNVSVINALPVQLMTEVENLHKTGCLNKTIVLQHVVKWELNKITTRWNLTDINPK